MLLQFKKKVSTERKWMGRMLRQECAPKPEVKSCKEKVEDRRNRNGNVLLQFA